MINFQETASFHVAIYFNDIAEPVSKSVSQENERSRSSTSAPQIFFGSQKLFKDQPASTVDSCNSATDEVVRVSKCCFTSNTFVVAFASHRNFEYDVQSHDFFVGISIPRGEIFSLLDP